MYGLKVSYVLVNYSDFDGDISVDTVIVIEINAIDAEPLKAGLASRPNVAWLALHFHHAAVCEFDAKFSSKLNMLSDITLL